MQWWVCSQLQIDSHSAPPQCPYNTQPYAENNAVKVCRALACPTVGAGRITESHEYLFARQLTETRRLPYRLSVRVRRPSNGTGCVLSTRIAVVSSRHTVGEQDVQ
jgi:hypothetical protein